MKNKKKMNKYFFHFRYYFDLHMIKFLQTIFIVFYLTLKLSVLKYNYNLWALNYEGLKKLVS